jgi:hypothetical protein
MEQDSVLIEIPSGNATLDIFVENLGRINYGAYLNDNRKGITEKVLYNGEELKNWKIYGCPMNGISDMKLKTETQHTTPVIRKGVFNLTETGDTWLDFSDWGKGCVWLNGHNLGRYWNIGPTQTIYVPAPWLKVGENNIVIFEELKYNITEIKGVEKPILDIMGIPVIKAEGRFDTLNKKCSLRLVCKDEAASIYYTLDGSKPTNLSLKYSKPLTFNKAITVSAIGQKKDLYSDEVLKINILPSLSTGCKLSPETKYSYKYPGGGKQALVDGFLGSNIFADGFWQGYEGVDMNGIIDLGENKDILSIRVNFIQDIRSWIFLPSQIEVSVSDDGQVYTTISVINNTESIKKSDVFVSKTLVDYNTTIMKGKKARYISIKAKNIGVCPPDHPGAGGKAWLFVDEITVN